MPVVSRLQGFEAWKRVVQPIANFCSEWLPLLLNFSVSRRLLPLDIDQASL